jgi:hypothetical protein
MRTDWVIVDEWKKAQYSRCYAAALGDAWHERPFFDRTRQSKETDENIRAIGRVAFEGQCKATS